MRQGYRTTLGGFGPSLTPTVKVLLAANISVFVLQFMLGQSAARVWFDHFFGLVPRKALAGLHVWQFATYMFLHLNFMHIFWNMFILWMFGSELDALWGRRGFLQYYFVAGIGAGLVYFLLMPLIEPAAAYAPLIGASGACFGLLMAYGLLFPERRVMLWFLIPVKVKWFVLGIGLFELMAIWRADSVGHLAHLGGLLFGYLYLRGGKKWLDGLRRGRRRRKADSRFRVVDDEQDRDPVVRVEVDRILEKISREGLDSLTPAEQEALRRASRKH
ncbi:rhomboid family intramembrane serine protease [bacterium]|nr:rhomboid family intramembrane serine protease [bacterium]MBU1072381.1 rhomboid family intramembrane serine protease [bacterium]MBU1676813.1 rhomboid family intramembrane serine protease [bacterium]